jgi:hypothetical protein
MRHEEARRRLLLGADVDAEAHVAACATCLEAIEREDPLVLALREANPAQVAAPPQLAQRVIVRWTWRRRLPWVAAGGGLAAASIAAAALLWVLAATFNEPVSVGGSALAAVLAAVTALATAVTDVLRSRFLDPAWFTALVVIAVLGAVGSAVLYREARPMTLRVPA